MHRVLFQIGPFTLYSYGFVVAAGFLLSAILVLADSKRFKLDRESVFDCLIAILIGGIVGGRLLFVFINLDTYLKDPLRVLMLNEGGMAFHGALVGAVLGSIIVCVKKNLPFWKTADVIAPYIALGHAVGRIGCLLNGCCYGKVTTGPLALGVIFEGEIAMRVPTQIYSTIFLLALYVVLIELRDRRRFDGYVFSMYIILYSIFRFFIEFWRGDTEIVLFNLTLAQIISIIMIFCGVVLYKVLSVNRK
jgi:phosphatidylglycerol:prolipoprotein diacylglycerol transferase